MDSICKRGGARGAGGGLLLNSFGLVIIACTACDREATAPEPPIRVADTVKVPPGPAPVKVGDEALLADTFTNKQTGEVLKGTLLGTVAIGGNNDYLVKLGSGRQCRLPVSDWDVQKAKRSAKPPARRVGIWEGFRGIAWGTHVKEIEGMELVKASVRGPSIYKRASDKLAMGKARLSKIEYGFYKDRFYHVWIDSASPADFRMLKLAVFATYGEGHSLGPGLWGWGAAFPGGKGVEDVHMCLDGEGGRGPGGLVLDYVPILNEVMRD